MTFKVIVDKSVSRVEFFVLLGTFRSTFRYVSLSQPKKSALTLLLMKTEIQKFNVKLLKVVEKVVVKTLSRQYARISTSVRPMIQLTVAPVLA